MGSDKEILKRFIFKALNKIHTIIWVPILSIGQLIFTHLKIWSLSITLSIFNSFQPTHILFDSLVYQLHNIMDNIQYHGKWSYDARPLLRGIFFEVAAYTHKHRAKILGHINWTNTTKLHIFSWSQNSTAETQKIMIINYLNIKCFGPNASRDASDNSRIIYWIF